MAQQGEQTGEVLVEQKVTVEERVILDSSDVNVHKFSPEESPEEKARKITEKNSKASTAFATPASGGLDVISDLSTDVGEDKLRIPGSIDITSASEIPAWARTGWQRV